MLTRRAFLKNGTLALYAAGAAPLFLSRAAQAASTGPQRRRTLVVLFQRGGMDGLMAVTPYTDSALLRLRPRLMLPLPGSGEPQARLDLDGRHGLHPSFAPLLPLYRAGELAIVHGAGAPDTTRSHLDATQWWESGTPGNRVRGDGWLNRTLAAAPASDSPLRALALTAQRPRILYGAEPALAIADLGMLQAAPDPLALQYRASDRTLLRRLGSDAFETSRLLSPQNLASYAAAADYPAGSALGKDLRAVAQLVKAGAGLQLAFVESRPSADFKVSWDSHADAYAFPGGFSTIAADFAESVAAFWKDLGERREDVLLVTLTEFGRTVAENGGGGTDHGRGTCLFVLGTGLRGGEVHGRLPERFERDALEDRSDLPVTTDFRALLSGLLAQHLGIADAERVFPGWNGARLDLSRAG